jgi:hydrogenase maturation protease
VAKRPDNVLVIGYGNPGRRDDGLGPAAAAALEKLALSGVTVDADYQLTVEYASEAARHGAVVFIDAACEGPEPFAFRPIEPGASISFSTHSVQPDGVLALAVELFQARPAAYVLGIRGYTFNEFGEGLSARAQANLAAALDFIEPVIRNRTFSDGVAAAAGAQPAAAPVDEEH